MNRGEHRPNSLEPSFVILTTGNGHGSTGTAIRRYSVSKISGDAFTYKDDAVFGGQIIVNRFCLAFIAITDADASNRTIGASVNSNQLTTSISSIRDENFLMNTTNISGARSSGSTMRVFRPGDIIRSHDDTAASGNTASNSRFEVHLVRDFEI